VPPSTDPPSSLRANLRRAQELLRQAGWEVKGGVLRNAQGQAMELEYLDSGETRINTVASWMRNLAKLGITLRFRAVDYALYQQRLQKFDFDITTIAYQGTLNPGQELADLFGSRAADTEDSGNFPGVRSPAVDAMVGAIVGAKSQEALLPACHALERIIAHGHYLIPQWYGATHRMAYNAWRLQRPDVVPPYSPGELWAIGTWWATPAAKP
jgi:microcin C transport system substrate-binding protein